GGDGNDSISIGDGTGVVRGGLGNDTIHVDFVGTVVGGAGKDSLDLEAASGNVIGGTGNDTIFASGGHTVNAGLGSDKVEFGIDSHDLVFATGGGGHDLFQVDYRDGDNNNFVDSTSKFGIEVINDFTTADVLRFHERGSPPAMTLLEIE